jgi:tRNA G18 (ribose-2'-O)-methylase SpoU
MPVISIQSPDDPRLADYRALKERELADQGGKFIAEGEQLVRRLLNSKFAVDSILLSQRRVAEIAPLAPPSTPIFALSDQAIATLLGFKFHSGVMAVGLRGPARQLEEILGPPSVPPCTNDNSKSLLILPEINNAENLGSLVRTAAGFSCDAVLLGPRCADPFMRRSLRVSMGAALTLPIIRATDLPSDLQRLRDNWNFTLVASVLDPAATPLERAPRPRRMALLVGSEAQGLDAATLALCQQKVTIPMGWKTDSLNVAIAAAVLLYHFTRIATPDTPDHRPNLNTEN